MNFAVKNPELLPGGVLGCLIGLGFIAYGMTRTPHEQNYLSPWKKPLSVRTARLIYFPMVALVIFWGLHDVIHAF
jgi:hypothetical protein